MSSRSHFIPTREPAATLGSGKLRILFIDQSADDARLEADALRRAGLELQERTSTVGELDAALAEEHWDAVICDYDLGTADGLDVLHRVRERDRDVPFLLVSGAIGEERAAAAMRAGANDCIRKDHPSRLAAAVRREVEVAQARSVRRELEESLFQAQERYRRTFEEAPIGIAHCDTSGRFLTVNARFCEITGYRTQELIGHKFNHFGHPEDRERTDRLFHELLTGTRESMRFERRYIRKDGAIVWVAVTLSVTRTPAGAVDYVIGLVEDVTAHRAANEMIAMQSRLLECVDQSVIATDVSGAVTYWNRVSEEMFGWTASEVIGHNLLEFTPAAASATQAAAILERLQRGETWTGEILLRRKDGSTFPALIADAPVFDADGQLIGLVGVAHDMAGQKRIENELRAHQEQLAAAQELARLGSWVYDCATGQRTASESMRRLWGFDPHKKATIEEAYARVHPDDRERLRQLQRQTHETFEPLTTEFRILRDGEVRTMVSSFRFSFDEHGNPVNGIGVMQDITERKQAEEEVRRRAIQQTAVANLGQLALTGASTEFLLEQAVSAVREVLGTDFAAVIRLEGEDYLLAAGAGWPDVLPGQRLPIDGNSQIGYTLRTLQAVMMPDATSESRFRPSPFYRDRGVVSGVTVPVFTSDGAWAVLSAHSQAVRAFVPHDVDFLRSIATLIGQAIDRTRSDAALRTRARQQSAIAKLGRMILTSIDDEVFERACELLMFGIGADYAFVNELTANNTLRLRAGHVWMDLPSDMPIHSSLQAGQTILSGEPVVVDEYATEERFETYERTVPYGIHSGVMVPIASSRRTFGVLSAQSKRPRHFREDDIDFVQALANMLAEAIEREAARRAIEQSEHRYRRIFDGATEIIFTIDPQGRFIAINPAFETITGWTRDEWLGRPYRELLVREDRDRVDGVFQDMLANGSTASLETRLLGKDRIVWIEVASFPQTHGNEVVEIYGFARDVTEARRAMLERERLTRNLELLLESTVEGIFTLDLDGRCTMINRAAAEILHHSPQELLGREMHEVVHDARTRDACAILDVIRSGASCTAQNENFVRSDGSTIPVAYSAAPIIDNGVRIGVVVTFTDLTERRKLEAKLEQANRVSSLGRLAATVAHEFNNVLMGIAPFVEVVRRAPSPQKVASALDHITNSVRRGRRITQDILRFTQPAEPVRAKVDIDSWLHGMAIEARSVLSPQYAIELDVQPLRVEADPNQLHQIFMNLILNARDAMPDGGRITITARREPRNARFPFGLVENPSRYVHFCVHDEGIGMSEETLRQAFEPLFTTKKSGTGLGLAVTHQVVLRHGGEIFIESAPNAGTTFHLFLPLAEPALDLSIAEAGGEPPQDRPAQCVLLVEDDPSVAAGLSTLLEFEGFVVDLASTGAEAIEKVRHATPDVVLLDVGLPDMDGQSVYAAIAAMKPDLPVIFSTGHADRGRLEELLAKPNVTYLLKPYDTEALLQALGTVMTA